MFTTWPRATPPAVIFFRRYFAAPLLLVLCPMSVAYPQNQLTVDTLIGDAVSNTSSGYRDVEEAITRFSNRDFAAARDYLKRAKESDPRLPPTDLILAKMYLVSGQLPAGRAALERCVRDHPEDPEPFLILADQLYTQGRLIEAGALYDKALSLISSFSGNNKRKRNFVIRAHAGSAAVASARQQWESAIQDLQKWVAADPESAAAHHRLGRALFLNRQVQDGFKSLSKARELDQSLINPYVTAAVLYEQLGERDKALQTFRHAVEADQNNPATLTEYAKFLIQSNNIEEAEKILENVRSAAPDSLEALILSGVVAKMANKRKPAEDYLIEALAISPTNQSVIDQLAKLLIEQIDEDKRKRALEFASINAQLYSNNADANITLAWVLYQLRRNREANQALQKGLQLGNLDADSKYLMAQMLVDQGQKENAKRLLAEALDSSTAIFVSRNEAQSLHDSL